MISLAITAAPRPLKNRPKPIGDTWIGLHGRKYRVVSNGEKKATPKPPLVIASSTLCEAVAMKNRPSNVHHSLEPFVNRRYSHNTTVRLHTAANESECDSPRCPSKSP